MSEHRIALNWRRTTADFEYKTYSRDHTAKFKNGQAVGMSATPKYLGSTSKVDPEEMLVASLSSCHMLTFLAIAAQKKLVIDSYDVDAVGVMARNAEGKLAITQVTLRPRIVFSGAAPDEATLEHMHHDSHEQCFIASSVKCEVSVEPQEVHA
jgi:organic hydroperoxide reductase OsmC/OhrA